MAPGWRRGRRAHGMRPARVPDELLLPHVDAGGQRLLLLVLLHQADDPAAFLHFIDRARLVAESEYRFGVVEDICLTGISLDRDGRTVLEDPQDAAADSCVFRLLRLLLLGRGSREWEPKRGCRAQRCLDERSAVHANSPLPVQMLRLSADSRLQPDAGSPKIPHDRPILNLRRAECTILVG